MLLVIYFHFLFTFFALFSVFANYLEANRLRISALCHMMTTKKLHRLGDHLVSFSSQPQDHCPQEKSNIPKKL